MAASLTTEQTETLRVLDAQFRLAVDHPLTRRFQEEADLAFQFFEGHQWTSPELQTLRDRGQPAIVENEIKPVIERLLGKFRQQRTTVKFVGRNSPDDGLATGLSDLLRFVDQQNDYEFTESEVVQNGLVCGRGVLEVCIERDAMGQRKIVERWDDPFTIFPDPFSRAFDWNEDARFIHRAKWMDLDEALARWPDKKAEIEAAANGGDPSYNALATLDPQSTILRSYELYYDHDRRRLRPVETWYKQRSVRRVLMSDTGVSVDVTPLGKRRGQEIADQLGTVVHEQTVSHMWVAVWCAGNFLDGPKPSPYQHGRFPWIQYRAYSRLDGTPYGYVKGLIDPQREINARRSRYLWWINNRQSIYEENAIKDKTELAEELAKADGQIEVRAGKFERFSIRENVDIGVGNLNLLQEAKAAMRRISGEDQLNPAPEVRSGTGIQRLQMIHQTGVLTLYDRIRQYRGLKARLVYELIRQYYTDEVVFQITDDPNVTRTIQLSADQFQTLKQRTYDLIVADTQDHLTAQSEQFDMLTTVLPQVIPFGPQWAALLISMSDLRNKEGLLQMLQQMTQPPPVDPKVSVAFQWNEITPEQQAALALQFGWQTLAQAVQANPQAPANLIQNQAEMMKTQMKVEGDLKAAALQFVSQRQSDHTKARTEQKKADGKRVSDSTRPA